MHHHNNDSCHLGVGETCHDHYSDNVGENDEEINGELKDAGQPRIQ